MNMKASDQQKLREMTLRGIDSEIAQLVELRRRLASGPGKPKAGKPPAKPAKRSKMSAAARKAMSERMKARWAELRNAKSTKLHKTKV